MRDQFFDQLGGAQVADHSGGDAKILPGGAESRSAKPSTRSRLKAWPWAIAAALIGLAILVWLGFAHRPGGPAGPPGVPLARVTVSQPLVRNVDTRIGLLGQFSAINRVELRAQVGGTLTEIHFQDGQIVNKGDLLFVIDPRPYEIRLARANALLQTAQARLALATSELSRAQSLQRSSFATPETVDQRTAEQNSAQAAIDDAKAQIRDAQLDLEYTRITAHSTGS